MHELKAVSLQVTNVLGIEEITIDLSGSITQISGANGQGKTSCIEALKSVLTSADSGTLLRNGAKHGSSVLILSDGSQIVSALKPGKASKRAMFDAEGRTVDKAATRIAELFDAHSLNPVDFLNAKGKARIDILLDAMPIELNHDRLKAICGPRFSQIVDANFDPLSLIAGSRQSLYDLRTGDNRIVKETSGAISTLQQSLASAQPFDADRLTHCKAAIAKMDEELKDKILRAKQNYSVTNNECKATISASADFKLNLKQEYERKCREIDDQIKDDERIIAGAMTNAQQNISSLNEQSILKKSATNTEIELLEAAQKAFEGQEATRQSIKGMQAKVAGYASAARMLTDAIDGIDAYKAELLANMPIKGLVIDGDKLMLDGIPFDRVNTAKRVGVAMKLAVLRTGRLKMILVDGLADIMDSKTLEQFYTQANESGCQIVVTRVKDDKLMATKL